jgi:hypothetical protein
VTPAELHLERLGSCPTPWGHRCWGKLRSSVSGNVREVIQRAVTRILVDIDGGLTIEVKPGGLLGLKTRSSLKHPVTESGRNQ